MECARELELRASKVFPASRSYSSWRCGILEWRAKYLPELLQPILLETSSQTPCILYKSWSLHLL